MLTSRLRNKVFQLFTEIINLASILKCVLVKYGALLKKKGHRWLNFARRAVFHIAEEKKKCMGHGRSAPYSAGCFLNTTEDVGAGVIFVETKELDVPWFLQNVTN